MKARKVLVYPGGGLLEPAELNGGGLANAEYAYGRVRPFGCLAADSQRRVIQPNGERSRIARSGP